MQLGWVWCGDFGATAGGEGFAGETEVFVALVGNVAVAPVPGGGAGEGMVVAVVFGVEVVVGGVDVGMDGWAVACVGVC